MNAMVPYNCFLLISFASLLDEVCAGGTEKEMLEALDEDIEQGGSAWKYAPLSGPHFDLQHSKNVSSQLGKTAVLNCRVKYAGGKTVSWMRSRDLHLLTVGRFTYTSDDRFEAVHQSGSEDWLLMVHYVQQRDEGAYECQVSTTPPLSHSVWLNVVAEPETKIIGGPDIYINSGSTINLTCLVSNSPSRPSFIHWYHDKESLSYDSSRGGITLVTENGPKSTSRLLIQKASLRDAGKYSCHPEKLGKHSITVHIIHHEHPAAIHHKNGTSSGCHCRSVTCDGTHIVVFFTLLLQLLLSTMAARTNHSTMTKYFKDPLLVMR